MRGDAQAVEYTVDESFIVIAERCRTLYVRVPKAACTTMLWGLLELEGHDPDAMNKSRKPLLSTKDVLVHDQGLYPVPTLPEVSPAIRSAALTSSDWLRIAVVRNPFSRLYSAWESKVLLNPAYNRKFSGAPGLVEDERGIDVGASFRSFVAALSEQPEWWMSEEHFRRQVDMVPTANIEGIELVRTEGIPDLFRRLGQRVGRTVSPRRSNEGLGIDVAALLDEETAERVQTLYAADFELTGIDPTAIKAGEPVYLDPTAVSLLRLAAARSERTSLLHRAYQGTPEQRMGNAVRRLLRKVSMN